MSFVFLVPLTAVLHLIKIITISAFFIADNRWITTLVRVASRVTRTERVAYEGMIDGCHVFVTADWRLSPLTGGGGPDVGFGRATVSAHRQAAPSASANLIASVRIYITICHIIIYLELLASSLSVLHHVFILLWPQKQRGSKPQMDLQWLIINLSVIICRGDNMHTCNLHQTAVLMMHVLSFI